MIKLPFNTINFASEMKPKISGMNLSLDYHNIESSLFKVAANMPGLISEELYNRLADAYPATDNVDEKTAIDYLQRAMLHFAVYEHMIYIILNIGNDGITTKKTDTETTAYKYQTDELNNNLLTTAFFWMNMLISFLDKKKDEFVEWKDSEQKKAYDNLPVRLADFNKWVGVEMSGGEYFILSAGWIIREVWTDCVLSRMKEPAINDVISRAVCYEVMGRACERLAYSALPSPIRRDIDNEMSKNHRAQADQDIRKYISVKFLKQAETYWNAVDLTIKKAQIAEQKKTVSSNPIIGSKDITETDKFYFS